LADLNMAIMLHPFSAKAYANRGHIHMNTGKYDEAIEDFTAAITIDGSIAAFYRYRGAVYGEMNQRDKAIADLATALSLDPEYVEAYLDRGDIWRRSGEGFRGYLGDRPDCKRFYSGLRVENDFRFRIVRTPSDGGVEHLRAPTPRGVALAGTNQRKLVSKVLNDTSKACFDGIIQEHEFRLSRQEVAFYHRLARPLRRSSRGCPRSGSRLFGCPKG
jgi:tetratricopeptide (TPR) repeat protein